MSNSSLKQLVRTIPDFPKAGIQFRDISTLLKDSAGFRQAIDKLCAPYMGIKLDKIVAIESRGFILGGAMADKLNCGFVMARKKGKLPFKTQQQEYQLEYGKDCIEIHVDAINPGDRVLIVDDLLATGGTCEATCMLVEKLGGHIEGCSFVIDLPELKGRNRLAKYRLHWLIEFEGH